MTDVSLMLDWVPNVAHLGYAVAIENGYYEEEGLNVTLVPGRGSKLAAQAVGSGTEDFGIADGSTLATSIEAGLPLKMTAAIQPAGASGLAFLCDTDISKPEDVVGKRIAGPAGTGSFVVLATVLEDNGFSATDYEQVIVDSGAKVASVLGGQADAMTVTTYDVTLQRAAAEQGKEACAISFADWGYPTIWLGIVANTFTLESSPELVCSFTRASMRGWEAAREDPVAARDALNSLFPGEVPPDEDTDLGWTFMEPSLETENTEGKPLGWMAPEDWDFTLSLLEKGEIIKERLADESYYTNECFPDA